MKTATTRFSYLAFCALGALFILGSAPLHGADGSKWDGKKYLFSLKDPAGTNSEDNPFIIDTAGKFAYMAWLGNNDNLDLVSFGKKNGLTGLYHGLNGNYFKITADLDMNGSAFELPCIKNGPANLDGGDHTISNLRISDTTTLPVLDSDFGTATMDLALFGHIGNLKNLHIGKGSSVSFAGVYKKFLLTVRVASIALEAWTMDNCSSEASIQVRTRGDAKVAGIVLECPLITNCHNRGNIQVEGDVIMARDFNLAQRVMPGPLQVGGVCIYPEKKLADCSNSGSIQVRCSAETLHVGGLSSVHINPECWNLENTGPITVTATGDIKTAWIGGLVAYGYTTPSLSGYGKKFINSGLIRNSGSITVNAMTGKSLCVGGIGAGKSETSNFGGNSAQFGGAYGFINACNTGPIKVSSSGAVKLLAVGGITGREAMIFNSYNSAPVSASSGPGTELHLGGLGGYYLYTQNSYNCGSVTADGSGTNSVGGLIGTSNGYWGETEKLKYSMLDSVWYKDAAEGGTNSNIKYARGSFTGSGDGYAGLSWYVDSPDATVLTPSDNKGKRTPREGTLLDMLNSNAAAHADRYYRLWKVDPAQNGGFPVFE